MAKRGKLLNIMAKRCRICLINNGFMIKLRDKLVESKLKDLTKCTCIDVSFANMILHVLSVLCLSFYIHAYFVFIYLMQIGYKKNLPDEVCYVCFYKLSMWSEFKELFVHSHKVLLKHLEKISEASNNAVSFSISNGILLFQFYLSYFNFFNTSAFILGKQFFKK